MKKIILTILITSLAIGTTIAQGKRQAKVEFETLEHDFGKINESAETVSFDFKLKNVGTAPLIIQRVISTCSTCSASEYPQRPILPGKEEKITVTYKTTGNVGVFRKKITVFSNSEEPSQLTVKGEVLKK